MKVIHTKFNINIGKIELKDNEEIISSCYYYTKDVVSHSESKYKGMAHIAVDVHEKLHSDQPEYLIVIIDLANKMSKEEVKDVPWKFDFDNVDAMKAFLVSSFK